MHETKHPQERALLVGVNTNNSYHRSTEYSLQELSRLADTALLNVIDSVIHSRPKIDPAYYIGRGKAQFIAELIADKEIDVVVFDEELSPGQAKNLEKLFEAKVIDRSCLILDIFARRAKTHEARTQVELAQLKYLLPRLTKMWTHFSRQVGGVGVRGPGETQLEVDRRLVRRRISHLSGKLDKIEHQRKGRRESRKDIYKAALIGYTNTGKSTLLNALTKADTFVENQLFATLDPTIRTMENLANGSLKGIKQIVLSDTVGFIHKLPHHLVASFRSTLEEVKDASLLIHVIDVTHPEFEHQITTVRSVLYDLEVKDYPTLYVFNKIDTLEKFGMVGHLKSEYAPAVFVSAARHMFIEELKQKISELASADSIEQEVQLSIDQTATISRIYDMAHVTDRHYENDKVILKFRATKIAAQKIKQLLSVDV